MDDQLVLVCLIIDDACAPVGDGFIVRIAPSAFIGDLATAIKEKNSSDLRDVDARNLIFWKSTHPLPLSAFRKELQTFRLDRVTRRELNVSPKVEALSTLSRVSEYFQQQDLPKGHVHVLAQLPRSRKRKHDDTEDVSRRLIDKWKDDATFVPKIIDLKAFLDPALALEPEAKIPISDQEWRRLLHEDLSVPQVECYPDDLDLLFIKSEAERSDLFHSIYVAIVWSAPESTGTEDSFHTFWDMNILHPLLNCLGQPTWIRNSNQSTDTGSYLPNLGILMRRTCTFRGEEKGPLFSGKHPRVELIEKTRWVYDPAPYVLGYYAVGANVAIVAIHPRADKQGVVVTDIVSEDLSRRKGRIRNIVRMIRLAKVLRAIDCTGVGRDMDVDMFPLIRDNGQLIEFSTKKIRKHYPSANQARISFLKTIYGHLETKRVPNVDHLTKVKISDDHCSVELEPRGTDSGASSTKDVRNAVFSILTALKVLHAPEPQIFNRDIRWPNVIRTRNNPDEWFLIDFEDAAIAPTKAAPNLRPETHSPHVFKDGHGAEVDIWGVGRLIESSCVLDLPEKLCSLGRRMVEGSVVSAEQALIELQHVA